MFAVGRVFCGANFLPISNYITLIAWHEGVYPVRGTHVRISITRVPVIVEIDSEFDRKTELQS